MRVLFLCTGNYYRSRFAEEYFNALARRSQSPHRAYSRGLARDFERLKNPGPVSEDVRSFLRSMDIHISMPVRTPRRLVTEELPYFDLIICLDKKEHLPMVRKRPELKKRKIVYWKIKDLDKEPAAEALPKCRQKVEELLKELEKVS